MQSNTTNLTELEPQDPYASDVSDVSDEETDIDDPGQAGSYILNASLQIISSLSQHGAMSSLLAAKSCLEQYGELELASGSAVYAKDQLRLEKSNMRSLAIAHYRTFKCIRYAGLRGIGELTKSARQYGLISENPEPPKVIDRQVLLKLCGTIDLEDADLKDAELWGGEWCTDDNLAKDGQSLSSVYPKALFPSFTKVNDGDVKAVVKPLRQAFKFSKPPTSRPKSHPKRKQVQEGPEDRPQKQGLKKQKVVQRAG